MIKGKNMLSFFIGMVILVTAVFPITAYAEPPEVDFTISNPYKDVDWNTNEKINYKANLHCHTWASDGNYDVRDIIKMHYDLGYDALALTDHGIVDKSWTSDENYSKTISILLGYFKTWEFRKDKSLFPKMPNYLTEEEYIQYTTPDKDQNGRYMIHVPNGIEHNPTSFNNAHVNSWYADYGNGILGGTSDYETPISNVDALGGLSVINHPGEYSRARYEDNPEKAYNEDYDYYINKYADVLSRYDSCIGIDMNSKGDGRTRNDRKLWDILLQRLVPTGRNVFGIATSDAHKMSAVDTGWIVYCTNKGNTAETLRECLETGSFFAGARNIENVKELAFIEAQLGKKITGKDGTWSVKDSLNQPVVKSVAVDEAEDTITIDVDNALLVYWIADGKVIATGNTIDLDNHYYNDEIGSYVRAEIFGEGGILYSQAFTLDYNGAPSGEEVRFFDWNIIWRKIKEALIGVIKVD